MTATRVRARGRGYPRAARGALAALGVCALSGCYRMVPAPVETLHAPERVRVALAPPAAERVSQVLNFRTSEVNGEVVAVGPEGLTLRVLAAPREQGVRSQNLYQQVVLTPGELLGVRLRELDRGRTALAAGGAAVALAVIVAGMLSGESGGTPPPGSDGSAEALVPLPHPSVR